MRKKKVISLFLFISSVLFIIPGLETDLEGIPGISPTRIPKITGRVKIDGILNEKVWREALVIGLNYEVEPGENINSPVKTEVLLAYDDSRLYVAFRAYDPAPAQIRAHVTDRDNIWEDDYVGIILDTFNDSRCTYNFYCNPLGVQADQVIGAIGDDEWDAIWNSAGRINKDGYSVEMAIPFSLLRFQKEKGEQIWRIDAERCYPRNLTHIMGIFPRDRDNNCYMCQAMQVIGFRGVRAGKNIELDPTFSTLVTYEREGIPDGKFIKKTGKVEPGFTGRWRFSPNMTLSTAVNPDFSHVEADAAQLDINTQFALYYPEKRPFFLEGASIFRFPTLITIYSRTVVYPNWGIKVTGKEGKHAIGFFSVQDSITNLLFPGTYRSRSTSVNMNNMSTVLRYLYDVGKSSNLGIVITDREGEDYSNRLLGVDGNLKITNKDLLTFQFLGSRTHYPEAVASEYNQPRVSFSGTAIDLFYQHKTEHIDFWGQYQQITPNFRADAGLIRQTGFKGAAVSGGYTWRHNPGYWYTSLNIGSLFAYEIDWEGNLIEKIFQGWINYNGPMQSSVNVFANFGRRTFLGVEFDDRYLNFDINFHPSGSLLLKLSGYFGDQVDFENVQAGTRLSFNPAFQYKIGRHLFVGVDHVFERLNVRGGRLYTANLSNIRLIYQVSKRAFLRTILQYADFHYNPTRYGFEIDPVFRHLFSQVLFSYKINPQTVLFLGYSDDYYGYDGIPLKQNNRTLFLKIGYALVL